MLDLSDSPLRHLLPTDLHTFRSLRELISRNDTNLAPFMNGIFDGMSGLEVIDLRGCGLTALPDNCFKDTTNLKRLLLGGNRLSVLPSLAHCPQLQELDVSGNVFTELPDLSGLLQLEHLDVSNNRLPALPIARLPLGVGARLATVLADHNQIADLPLVLIDGAVRRQMVLTLHNNPCWAVEGAYDLLRAYEIHDEAGRLFLSLVALSI